MKSIIKLSLKKAKNNLPQLIGLVVLITIGVGFFLTLFTIKMRYEQTANAYFANNHFANLTLKGRKFDQDSILRLENLQGVYTAKGRTVKDIRDGERLFRTISLTQGINQLHIYEGRLPTKQNECVILKRSADAMGLKVGSAISLGGKKLAITGLVSSCEYIYLYQSERTPMALAENFAVLFLPESASESFNEILMLTNQNVDKDIVKKLAKASQIIERKEHFSTVLYESDLKQIGSFAYIFPVIFAVLIAAIIVVMLSRMVQKDRKQIGILKALGTKSSGIFAIYLLQFCIAAVLGTALGLIVAFLLGDWIISVFGKMFEVPALSFVFNGNLFAFALVFALIICVLSGGFSIAGVAALLPAVALRPKPPKQGKKIFLEKFNFWERLSFNTRYTIKGIIKSKWRFLVVVLGMSGSCALMAFSLGFLNSVTNTLAQHMNNFAEYDIIIDIDPLPIKKPFSSEKNLDKTYKAFTLPIKVQNKDTIFVICESGFDMVNLPVDKLDSGVIVPNYLAQKWGVAVGDKIEIDGYDVQISALVPQVIGLNVFTSYKYLASVDDSLPKIYNTIYGKSDDLSNVISQLKKDGTTYSTREDEEQSFKTIMQSLGILIVFLIAFSVILGLVVLYSVGIISICEKEFEYMFMGIMGYGRLKVFAANVKETLFQLAISLPLGCFGANILLNSIKGEFSTDNFVIQPFIAARSYIIAAGSVFAIAVLMAILTDININKLDIVEGLKVQDD